MLTDRELLDWTHNDIKYYSKRSRAAYVKLKLSRLKKLIAEFREIDTISLSYEESVKLSEQMRYRVKAVDHTIKEIADLS